MFSTGVTMGLAECIIHDTCLVQTEFCQDSRECIGIVVGMYRSRSYSDCLDLCNEEGSGCNYITFMDTEYNWKDRVCLLFQSCDQLTGRNDGYSERYVEFSLKACNKIQGFIYKGIKLWNALPLALPNELYIHAFELTFSIVNKPYSLMEIYA